MKRGELINRGIAAVITLAFMTLVRPDPDPALWEMAMVAIMMYEALRWCVWYIRRIQKKKRIELNNFARREDGKRLDAFWIKWPMKEVS